MSHAMYLVGVSHTQLSLPNTLADHAIGPQGLLATKARVLVTNSIAFISQFDKLVFLRRGIILETGSYEMLMANPEGEVSKLV